VRLKVLADGASFILLLRISRNNLAVNCLLCLRDSREHDVGLQTRS
jgi:hypothetical protein